MSILIDTLIVKLLFDASGFNRGTRETERSLGNTRRAVNNAADSMGKAIGAAARQFALAFLGFQSAAGVVKMLTSLSEGTRQLGLFARNTDESAAELKNWMDAVELAGGKGQDFLATVARIEEEQGNFLRTGTSSWSGYLAQLGDGTELIDRMTGKARPALEVLTSLARAFEKISREQGRPMAFTAGSAMGIDPGTLNVLIEGPAAVEAMLEKQRKHVQITQEAIDASTRLYEKWTTLKQGSQDWSRTLLKELNPQLEASLDWLTKLFDKAKSPEALNNMATALDKIGNALQFVSNLLKLSYEGWQYIIRAGKELYNLLPDWFIKADQAAGKFVFETIPGVLHERVTGGPKKDTDPSDDWSMRKWLLSLASDQRGAFAAEMAKAERDFGLPKGLLDKIAQRESGYRKDVIYDGVKSKAGAAGLMQLMPQYFPGAGADPLADIRTAGEYLMDLYSQFGSWEKAVAAYNTGPGSLKDILAGKKQLPEETRKYLEAIFGNPAALGAARGSGATSNLSSGGVATTSSSNSVNIGTLNVNGARDAEATARGMQGALERRQLVAQADSGMRP